MGGIYRQKTARAIQFRNKRIASGGSMRVFSSSAPSGRSREHRKSVPNYPNCAPRKAVYGPVTGRFFARFARFQKRTRTHIFGKTNQNAIKTRKFLADSGPEKKTNPRKNSPMGQHCRTGIRGNRANRARFPRVFLGYPK